METDFHDQEMQQWDTCLHSRAQERLLIQALWLQAGAGEGALAGRWQDSVVLGHDLLYGRLLRKLPAMAAITERSIVPASEARW